MQETQTLPVEYWGLERWPFGTTPRLDQLYPAAGHTEALARIEYLVQSRRRLGVLRGETGIGKSLVLQSAARQLERNECIVALIDALGITSRELLWQTAAGLGAAPADDADVSRLWREISDRVAENRMQQVHTVLLVDDADKAGPDVAVQLARLARLDSSPAARWTMVLAAEPAPAARWGETLRNLVDLRIDLRPWDLEETVGYVQTALVDAGRFEPVFEEAALDAIHAISGGVPRQVTRLADQTLLAGAAAQVELIDARTVEATSEDLSWQSAIATR